ncbi:MAG TPA: triose-phosphate isomerase [Candidatus Saccharimonadales bacterium]|nr:triose-phosphate isomerase [Candidatus Saccharimonadales bacterium]
MKRTLIVANWKMNLDTAAASLLVHRLEKRIKIYREIEVVLAPSMLVLQPLSLQIDRRKFRLAAQNAYYQDEGAYTGEVSFTMLQDLVHYAIIGHSDRRYKFAENLEMIREKVAAAVRNEISPILCVGETKQEKLDGETGIVLHDQVTTALSNLTSDNIDEVVIAYEPVWALSNGSDYLHHEIPKPDDITKAVKTIRNNIAHLYGDKVAADIRILYGGSTNSSTAHDLLSLEGIDGLLVGGASLNYAEFSGIVEAAYKLRYEKQEVAHATQKG